MLNSDILRRLRYALDISDLKMIEIFKLGGYETDKEELAAMLKKEDEEGYLACNDNKMESFLDGLIFLKRGKKDSAPDLAKKVNTKLTNNKIFKKLRIALELRGDDILAILKLANLSVSKSELNALFRREGHKHYKVCGDQFLRNFLKGLTIINRNGKII
ncbi:hypothetical protein B6I21_02345 [candidate division KSB1 bacterium 4572_119]|nr:MAG: hypothetical protein B6I21_02345 [candidate division KSB1 bacterium 4572_119]